MKKPSNPKERNLLKGAIRRVFSRSELRLQALAKHDVKYFDTNRPRVTKWSFCGECGVVEPRYKMEVDHISPVVKLSESLEDISWTEFIEERVWCSIDNLLPLCKDCHRQKSSAEQKERRRLKREKS